MSKKKTLTMALYTDFHTWNLMELIEGIRNEPCAANWQIIAHRLPEFEFEKLDGLDTPDGAFVYTGSGFMSELRRKIKCPMIQFSSYDARPEAPAVWPDDFAIGRIGAEHLLSLGLRNLAFVCEGTYYSQRRLAGFESTAVRSGHSEPIKIFSTPPPPYGSDFDPESLQQWLGSLPMPCGIMAATDPCALIISRLCSHMNIKIPGRFALLGVNNAREYCELAKPSISSIKLPYYEMGRAAAGLMASQINGGISMVESQPLTIHEGIALAVRESTDMVYIDDKIMAQVLDFLRKNAIKRPIFTKELLQRFKVTRHKMDSTFLRYLGHTASEEIALIREKHIKHLLASSNIKMVALVKKTGFKSTGDLYRFFKRRTAMTPHQWRKTIGQRKKTSGSPITHRQ